MNYFSGYPDLHQDVKCGNGLTSIERCKLLGVPISIGLGLLSLIFEMLLNLTWRAAGSVLQILDGVVLHILQQLYSI